MTEPAEKVAEARELLAAFGMDDERSNERSAMTLLSLLSLTPGDPWSVASNPMLGTRAIMDWIRDQYGVDYKPNTRETVRRFTLHQFADAQLIVQNPDQPDRPVNSPKWNYQVTAEALGVIRVFGTPDFEPVIKQYLADVPGLRAAYSAARDMNRIPVTLPDGIAVHLSPGGQNVLIKQIVDDFCAQFTPGGHVLYIGDASDKWAVFEKDRLAALGVEVDQHGKMPDLVVYLSDRNWLVLIEAASSHGPVDAKRHGELAALFDGCTAGLVYVSAFPDRAEMRKYLTQIAWETDVWCAEDSTHLIHFNGERFLGPY
ncbi:BsuBI/PstI family type II restriction endonuclease [Mycolicibacillus trivialis]|uniref:Restriction endonuclease n=1 Tax=Mycolicibacillus trivialis TaxID=1798 RepID=A0A1X2EL30_9MYCO|nr:BsuBI/PstI family type II restriction endonuclease [Mycolicibacillus trivialis]ORX04514.1 restriction endonuclease [Mycolicibacillus trivialis]